MMTVNMVNDGPVTFMIESDRMVAGAGAAAWRMTCKIGASVVQPKQIHKQ